MKKKILNLKKKKTLPSNGFNYDREPDFFNFYLV